MSYRYELVVLEFKLTSEGEYLARPYPVGNPQADQGFLLAKDLSTDMDSHIAMWVSGFEPNGWEVLGAIGSGRPGDALAVVLRRPKDD
jgi:hypothetical protein